MFSRTQTRAAERVAFTLVEVMLVILILGILAAAAISGFTPNVRDQLQSVGDVIVADLAYTRSLAVANNSQYTLTFDRTNNQYVLDHTGTNTNLEALPSSTFWTAGTVAGTQVMQLNSLPLGNPPVTLVGVFKNSPAPVQVETLEFGPLGGTTRTEDTTIWLGSCSGDQRRYISIVVNPTTGLATLGDFTANPPRAVLTLEGLVTTTPLAGGNGVSP